MSKALKTRIAKLEKGQEDAALERLRLDLMDGARHQEILNAVALVDESERGPVVPNGRVGVWRWVREKLRVSYQEPVFGAGRGVLRYVDLELQALFTGTWFADGEEEPGATAFRREVVACVVASSGFDVIETMRHIQTIKKVRSRDLGPRGHQDTLHVALVTDGEPGDHVAGAFINSGVNVIVLEPGVPAWNIELGRLDAAEARDREATP